MYGNRIYTIFFKQLVTALLLIAFTGHTFSKALIVADFYANQSYLARNFCINRNNPALHCGAHCLLTQKLGSEEKKDRQQPVQKTAHSTEQVASHAFDCLTVLLPPYSRPLYYRHNSGLPVDRPATVFHPPCSSLH